VAFAGLSFALVVGLAVGVAADLGDGHDVQGAVELAVAGAAEPVADHVAGGHLDRGDAGEGGEVCGGRESAGRAGSGQHGGRDDVTDTVKGR
jgi:hypothetical protein